MRVEDLLLRNATNANIALEYEDLSLTYEKWNHYSNNVKDEINLKFTDKHKNIAIFLPNSIQYAVAYFGILFSKNVIVPIGIKAKRKEIISTIRYCEVDLVVTNLSYSNQLIETLNEYENNISVYIIETNKIIDVNPKLRYIEKTNILSFQDDENDVAIMLHTSGTTSFPKRVMLTHDNLITNIESNIKSIKLESSDKGLIALPMFFGYCNTAQFLSHIYVGASMVIYDGTFMPKHFCEIVQSKHITNFTGVPTMLLMLLDYRYSRNYVIDSLRFVCFGGGNMNVNKLKMLIDKFPTIDFIQTYGQTECSPRVTALLSEDALKKIGSVGKPIPNVSVCIFDEKGNSLKAFEHGEIMVKGKNIMKGYYKRDEETRKVKEGEWLHTGDLGYIDDEGFLYLVGRKKNMIISGGINIYPEEIEQILQDYPGIQEVIVVGEEHEILGEVPIANIVVNNIENININHILNYCRENLASYKVPKRIEIVSMIEKTYNGKMKRTNRMEKKMIKNKLKELISSCMAGIEIEKITDNTDLMKDLGFESVNIVELIVEIEAEFNIEIDDKYMESKKLSNFASLCNIVTELCGENNVTL